MRNWWVLVALLVGLATPAHAKRAACAPSIAPAAIVPVPGDAEAPTAQYVGVDIEHSAISINGTFAEDTARIRVNYRVGEKRTELWTTPERRYLCTPDEMPDDTQVAITAIDKAGNETTSTVFATVRRHHRCGMGGFVVLFLIPVFAIGLAIVLFIISAVRRQKLKLPGLELSSLQAESMIRETINNAFTAVAITFGLTLALYITNDGVAAAIVGWFPVTRLGRLFLTRRFLRHIDRGTPLFLHGNLLATAERDFIIVPGGFADHAARHAMPTAQIRGLPHS